MEDINEFHYVEDLGEYIKNEYLKVISKKVRKGSPLLDIKVNVYYQGDYYSIVFDMADYWYYFESGRRPGKMPPSDIIEKWIKINRIIPKSINNHIPTTKQLAFVIARSIGKKGTKGDHDFENVLFSGKVDNKIDQMKQIITNQVIINLLDEFRDNIKIK